MNVELVKFPGRILQFEVEQNTSVGQLIEMAAEEYPDIDLTGEMKVNNNNVNSGTVLRGGDRLIITKKIKGNQITVAVNKFPGAKVELMLEHGATVGQAVEQAKETIGDVDGYDIRLNGLPAEASAVIPDNGSVQRIILTKKVKGN
jgi:putative ubiquitin-RnfH superfamily antitoxin RatB of RatAB toxin-antitoxin module